MPRIDRFMSLLERVAGGLQRCLGEFLLGGLRVYYCKPPLTSPLKHPTPRYAIIYHHLLFLPSRIRPANRSITALGTEAMIEVSADVPTTPR